MGWKGVVILARNWTTKEIQYIKRSALMDETNMTIGEIAEAFIKHGINNVTVKEGI